MEKLKDKNKSSGTSQDSLILENQKIIQGFRENNHLIINEWYGKCWRSIRALVKNKEDVDDLLQKSFVVFWRKCQEDSNFVLKNKLTTFIYAIAKNIQSNIHRKKKPIYLSEIKNQRNEKPSIMVLFEDKETLVDRCVELLEENCQKLIRAIYWEDKSRKEVSETLQKSVAAVRKQLQKCRQKLALIILQHPDYIRTKEEDAQFEKATFHYLYSKVFVPIIEKYANKLGKDCNTLILQKMVEEMPLLQLKEKHGFENLEVLKKQLALCEKALEEIIEAKSQTKRFQQQFPAYPQLKKYILNKK